MNLSNVRGFKLMNGAEIVGELRDIDETNYNIEKAVFWDLVTVDNGKYDIQFSPLSAGIRMEDGATSPAIDVALPKHSVLFMYEPRVEIETRYKRLVSPILLVS